MEKLNIIKKYELKKVNDTEILGIDTKTGRQIFNVEIYGDNDPKYFALRKFNSKSEFYPLWFNYDLNDIKGIAIKGSKLLIQYISEYGDLRQSVL